MARTEMADGLVVVCTRTSARTVMPGVVRDLHIPDSKIHGANVGLIWGRQDPGGPHVGHSNLAIWDEMFICSNNHHLYQHDGFRYPEYSDVTWVSRRMI